MEKKSKLNSKKLIIILAAVFLVCVAALGVLAHSRNRVHQVASQDEYGYVNPDETKADTDEGITIDGILDEEVYQKNNWLYLHNNNGNSEVDIAATSYYGEKGMYFVYDVTENTPIYVNLDRTSALNSCVEMYLATSDVETMDSSRIFEIDLLPTGDLVFKQRTGKGTFMDVATTSEIMPYLGVTTKGGEVNTEDCYGYNLEFFIPWEYMEWLDMPVDEMKDDYVNVNIAHIASFNYTGEDANIDRFWYSFAKQRGGNGWGNVPLYYHFDEDGVLQTVPVELVSGEHYTIKGAKAVIPGMKAHVTITPEEGYAIKSIFENGEDIIKTVSYNEDGSLTLFVKGVEEGLKISAEAEAVTAGNKTLSGTVKVHKIGGDNLNGVTISYKGPKGEKAIELDSKGKFSLADLEQGYYTITVEKKGYAKIERGIYLNRDIDTEITLEYQNFIVESGNCWDLDEQNDSILNKLGGSGSVISTDSYNKFTVEANFRYDTELAEEWDFTDCKEQRQGFRIKFSNEKYWHLHLLHQNDKYIVQYAKVTGDKSIFNFRNIYTLSEEEIAQYQSKDGIQFKLVRDGKHANIYLNGKLIAVEILEDEYVKPSAQVGFESWVMNWDVSSMKYKITGTTAADITNFYFGYHKGWDVTKQFEGVVSQPKGGNTVWLRFYDKLVNMDLSIKVKDDPRVDGENPRTSIRFEFDNEETFILSVCESAKGVVQIQKYPCTVTNNKWAGSYYNFTEDEKAQYKTEEGIDLRVVRCGTDFLLFVGGEYKTTIDLSEFVKADEKAIVSIQHLDDKDVPYDMPFTMSEKVEEVIITKEDTNGKEVVAEKGTFVVVSAEEGYYISSIVVNGKDVSKDLYLDGTYTFTAEESKNTIQATIAKRVFKTTTGWDLLEQNQGTNDKGATIGTVALPEGGSADGRLYFQEQYTDVDFTLTVKDDQSVGGINPRTTIRFNFDNGEDVDFSISSVYVNKETGNQVVLQNTDSTIYGKNKRITLYPIEITEENKVQTAKYESADGLDVRVVRSGTEFTLYFENGYDENLMNRVWYVDLAEYIKADTKATISIEHFDDKGAEIEIPFSITDKLEKVTISAEGSNGKKVLTDKNSYVLGDAVLLKAEEGYYISNISVNGKDVSAELNLDGTYSFTATETKYDIKATVKKSVVKVAEGWNVLKQNQGTKDGVTSGELSMPEGGYGKIDFYDKYANVDLTFAVKDHPDSDPENTTIPRTTVHFAFDNGETVNFSITSKDVYGSVIILQTTPCTVFGEKSWVLRYPIDIVEETRAQTAKYESADGIDFRVVRDGTKFYLYLEDGYSETAMEQIWSIDLAEYIKADTKATISIEHNDDKGTEITMPFSISDEVKKVSIKTEGNDGIKVVTDKDNYVLGQNVVVSGEEGYYISAISVNGKDVSTDLNPDGTYSFTATERDYKIKATLKEEVFKAKDGWNLLSQNESYSNEGGISASGKVILPDGGTKTIDFYDEYKDVDLTLTVKDDPEASGTAPRTTVRFAFDNEETVDFSISSMNVGGNVIILQTTDSTIFGNKHTIRYPIDIVAETRAQTAKYASEEGIDFRIVRNGTEFSLYLENGSNENMSQVWYVDLADHIEVDTKATIAIEHFDDKGTEIAIPYSITEKLQKVTLKAEGKDGEKLVTDKKNYVVGDTVFVSAEEGYYIKGVTNDKVASAEPNPDGTYSFTATENDYNVKATVEKTIVNAADGWNVLGQNQNYENKAGVLSASGEIVLTNGGSGKIDFCDQYADIDLTLAVKDDPEVSGTRPRTTVNFTFENGQTANFSISSINVGGNVVVLQTAPSTIYGSKFTIQYPKDIETDNRNETKKYESEDGIDFRIVRDGTEFFFYLEDPENETQMRRVWYADLSGKIEAGTKATVSIEHGDDKGTPIAIPFKVTNKVEKALINVQANDYGTISATLKYTTDKSVKDSVIYVGDTVVAKQATLSNAAYYLAGVKVNDTAHDLELDGTYTFIVDKAETKVEGVYKNAIFNTSSQWCLVRQNEGTDENGAITGTVSIMNVGATALTLREQYQDIDLTIRVKDHPGVGGLNPRTNISFNFTNGNKFVFGVNEDSNGVVQVENDTNKNIVYYEFTTAERTQYRTVDGIDLRVVREGYKLSVYVGGEFKKSIYLDDLGVDNSMKATVKIEHFDDRASGVRIEMPFKLSVPSKESMAGKYFSILGDEISMSTGMPSTVSNNTTTRNNSTMDMYGQNGGLGIGSDYKLLYWGQAQKTNQLQLLVNNSVSVGELAVTANATSHIGGYVRAEQLADNTDDGIPNGTKPDIIYLYMGTQDYKQKKLPLGDYTEAVVSGVKTQEGYKTPTTFTEAYIITLEKMQELYPDAEVFCFTLLPFKNTDYDKTVQANYNARIREIACDYENVTLVDVTDIITSDNYTTDSLYFDANFTTIKPKKASHDVIASELQKALESQFAK